MNRRNLVLIKWVLTVGIACICPRLTAEAANSSAYATMSLGGAGVGSGFTYNEPGSYATSGILAPGNYTYLFTTLANSQVFWWGGDRGDALIAANASFSLTADPDASWFSAYINVESRQMGYYDNGIRTEIPDVIFSDVAPTGATSFSSRFSTSRATAEEIVVAQQNLLAASSSAGVEVNASGRGFASNNFGPGYNIGYATSQVRWDFTLSAPTAFNFVGSIASPTAGSAPQIPVLPSPPLPGGGGRFENGRSGDYFDPPATYGFEFVMLRDSRFTAIEELPFGFDAPFTIEVDGQSLGEFSGGAEVDFLALLGHGVSSFKILGIDPAVDGEDPLAFPVKLAFDTETASFDMIAIAIPLAASCPRVPSDTCYSAGKSSVQLNNHTDISKRKLYWKWGKGLLALAQGDFGDPVNGSTTYALCVYDQTASTPVFKMSATIASGEMCGDRACWKAIIGRQWAYSNRSGNADGVSTLQLKSGAAGQPQVLAKGKGSSLAMPDPISSTDFFDQDPAVIMQLHSLGEPANCWSSTFDRSSTKKNDGMQFKAVTP